MRRLRFLYPSTAYIFCVLISLTSVVRAANPPASNNAPLQQMLATTHWGEPSLPNTTVSGKGRLNLSGGGLGSEGQIVLKFLGRSHARISVTDASGTRITIMSDLGAIELDNGRTKRLPAHVAYSTAPPFFPFLYNLPSVAAVHELGIKQIAGQACVGFRFEFRPPNVLSHTKVVIPLPPISLWISQSTSLPLQIDYGTLAASNYHAVMRYSRRLSDFRSVDGVLVPFTQQEFDAAGQLLYTVTLESVAIGAAADINPRDFDLPTEER